MTQNSVNFTFLPWINKIIRSDKRFYLVSGGRASGKSTQIAAYFITQLLDTSPHQYFRGVIARYTQKSLTNSIYRDIDDLIDSWGLYQSGLIAKKGDEIYNTQKPKNKIITHSFRMGDNNQTAKNKGLSNCTHLLIDEATEVPSRLEYQQLVDSFRVKPTEERQFSIKIILLFNPASKSHWIFKHFYLPDGSPNPQFLTDHRFVHTTYLDNIHNLDPQTVASWELEKTRDPENYRHQYLGEWKNISEGQIYTEWQAGLNDDSEIETFYGLDFGWTDPTALVKVQRQGKTLWITEVLYETNLTIPQICELMQQRIPKNARIFADAADPSSIEQLIQSGFSNLSKCTKGPNSIVDGIRKIKEYQVYLHPRSSNFWLEYQNYVWSHNDRPIDKFNHCMDALRYAMSIDKQPSTTVRISKPRFKITDSY